MDVKPISLDSAQKFPVIEKDVVKDLLEFSPEFKNFYENEKISTFDVKWWVDKNLENGINAMMFNGMVSGKPMSGIFIKRFPAPIEDVKTIAHELIHFIRNDAKSAVRIVAYDQTNTKLGAEIASLIEDPIVDGILQYNYGFDLISPYNEGLKKSKRNLRKVKHDPQAYIGKVGLMFQYSGIVLEWELIKDTEALKNIHIFQNRFKLKYRLTSKMSDDLISIVHEKETDNFDNRKVIYNKIINKFELQNMFYIHK